MSFLPVGELQRAPEARNPSPSKGKVLGFAVLIIVAIGGLAAAGVGLAGLGAHQGWWHAGAFSQLSQVNALIMLGVGGGGALLSLVAFSIGVAKSRRQEEKRALEAHFVEAPPLEPGQFRGRIEIGDPEKSITVPQMPESERRRTKIQPVDHSDWAIYPNEMLVQCRLSAIEGDSQSPIKNRQIIFLPFCLFTHDADETQWKREGEMVEFFYEECRYTLILTATGLTSLEKQFHDCVDTASYSGGQTVRGYLPPPPLARPPAAELRPITGTIAVQYPYNAQAFGPYSLESVLHTQNVVRPDGEDWTASPQELLIQCVFEDIQGEEPILGNYATLYLPFCLFIHNGDYRQWKKVGDKVVFHYGECRYELTLIRQTQQQFRHALYTENPPLEEQFKNCFKMAYSFGSIGLVGHNREPLTNPRKDPKPQPCLSPLEAQEIRELAVIKRERKRDFLERFPGTEGIFTGEFPEELKCEPFDGGLGLTCCGAHVEDIRLFFNPTHVGIHVALSDYDYSGDYSTGFISSLRLEDPSNPLRVSEYPMLAKEEFLVVLPLSAELTREKIQGGRRVSNNTGRLAIRWD